MTDSSSSGARLTWRKLLADRRVSAKQGHHENTFAALELALGPPGAEFARYFNICRKKRNMLDYNLADVVTETELRELLTKASAFKELVEDWISKNHPQLGR